MAKKKKTKFDLLSEYEAPKVTAAQRRRVEKFFGGPIRRSKKSFLETMNDFLAKSSRRG